MPLDEELKMLRADYEHLKDEVMRLQDESTFLQDACMRLETDNALLQADVAYWQDMARHALKLIDTQSMVRRTACEGEPRCH